VAEVGLSSVDALDNARIAIVVPCLNEESAVGAVVAGFQQTLPGATVYVYDNGSTDDTVGVASRAGAIVRSEPNRGKGNVVRRMFADIEADIYVMVDGDGTYDADAAPAMVWRLVDQNLDMVIGARDNETEEAYRRGHVLGNRFFSRLHRILFGAALEDVFSGYRVMSRRFVKSFPTTSSGFEIEAELTAHASDIKASCEELRTAYRSRGVDSASKLRTYRDGFRILGRSLLLYKEMHPAGFFAVLFGVFACAGLAAAVPVIQQYADTGQVLRVPLAMLAASLEVVAVVCLVAGVILDSIARRHREIKRLHYLSHHAPAELVTPPSHLLEDLAGRLVNAMEPTEQTDTSASVTAR
jgi:glycosyltransferase involved in cell wall biosynthesis